MQKKEIKETQRGSDPRGSDPAEEERGQTPGTGWGLTPSTINLFLRFLRFGGGLSAKLLRLALPMIQKLSKTGNYLRPSEEALKDEIFLRAHAAFLLNMMVCGAAVVRELDEKAKSLPLKDGLAVFEVEGTDTARRLRISEGKIFFENNKKTSNYDVKITFCDPMAVVEASQQKLDSQAAIGLGRVKISGSIPLADSLELLMNQIGVYLKV